MKSRLRHITIKHRLYATTIGILLILLFIGLFVNFYINQTIRQKDMLVTANEIARLELSLRKIEKDFIIHETINPDFFATGKSKYLDEFKHTFDTINQNIRKLEDSHLIEDEQINQELSILRSHFAGYSQLFSQIVNKTREKGFKDYGLIGEMRDNIHEVEDQLEKKEDVPELQVHMLMLRRHEKDYLLRKDIKYLNKFLERNKLFINDIRKMNQDSLLKQQDELLIKKLKAYENIFSRVVAKDIEIGLNEDQGLTHRFNAHILLVENQTAQLKSLINTTMNRGVKKTVNRLFLIIIILSVIITIILFTTIRYFLVSVKYLSKHLEVLSNGALPTHISPRLEDEVAQMVYSINDLTEHLQEKADFAHQIAQGNMTAKFKAQGNQDLLGEALLTMQHSLQEAQKAQELRFKEESERSWANEGLTQLNSILRQNQLDIEQLSYHTITFLMAYLEAAQSAMYVIDDSKAPDIFIKMTACIAYDRKHKNQTRIELEEGLVGRAIDEKETIVLTELPEDYIHIGSGLGDEKPHILIIVPLQINQEVSGAIEFAGFKTYKDYQIKFLEKAAETIASTLSSIRNTSQTYNLLRESETHSLQMVEQEEEMRQTIEELQATQEEAKLREAQLEAEIEQLKQENSRFKIQLSDNTEI